MNAFNHCTLRIAAVYAFLLAVGIHWSGCGEDSTSPGTNVEPTFSSIQANIFAKSCATASCHGTLGQKGGLILTADMAYTNLVNVDPGNLTAKSKGYDRVKPGVPDSSFLLIKLTGPGAGEGDRMPQSNPALDAQAIEAVREWIEQGAKND